GSGCSAGRGRRNERKEERELQGARALAARRNVAATPSSAPAGVEPASRAHEARGTTGSPRRTRNSRAYVAPGVRPCARCPSHSPTLRPWIACPADPSGRGADVLRGGVLEPEPQPLPTNSQAKANAYCSEF